MKKTILTFGLISGLLSAVLMLCTVPFLHQLGTGPASYLIGYTGMVVSFLLVIFGIRSYRDNVAGGRISFGRAFAVGICITLISCVFYVVTWEIVYFNFLPHSMDGYFADLIAKAQHSGGSASAIQAKVDQIQQSRAMYANPLYNGLLTFMEPFPVGLLITLVSAALLRRKPSPAAP